MQPFDALTMRAILYEARPLLLNRRVEKVYQVGRDEVIVALRGKAGTGYFLLSAQASFGRLCLIPAPPQPKHVNPPAFCQLLRKHLTGATLSQVDQLPGERVADLTFACLDELGNRSVKVLTAEIMGRHSNLIFWDKESQRILGASHVVTAEMSRQREVAPGLKYTRPPHQDKPSIFQLSPEQFEQYFQSLQTALSAALPKVGELQAEIPSTWQQWLLSTFSGLGRHLADEIVAVALGTGELSEAAATALARDALFARIKQLPEATAYKGAMKRDLTGYTVLSWWQEVEGAGSEEQWKTFPSVNDMIEEYFHTLHAREQMQQLKDRIRSELKAEFDKLESRLSAAGKQLEIACELAQLKSSGDMILANIHNIKPGQTELSCQNLSELDGNGANIAIALNPNLNAAQNAQHYYRQYAKSRVRQRTAGIAQAEASSRLTVVASHIQALESASTLEELDRLKEIVLDRGKRLEQQQRQPQSPRTTRPAALNKQPRLMSVKSSDGWIIYVGRNRQENDILIVKLAQPFDVWLHVSGQEGAHVLIKCPGKQNPPASTLQEAAQLAARFSRVSLGGKVRVAYTQCRFVRKIARDKPGLVSYENEKTLEVDTSAPMPPCLRKLFS